MSASKGVSPLISIITPTYNRAGLIEETIESILGQNYPNLDYIVLDDGSKDNTVEVMKKYDTKLRFYSHSNRGETATDNRGFELAKGEIIGVINSDDPLLPGALQKIAQVMTDHPEIMVVYPDWYMTDAHGTVKQEIRTHDYSYVDMVRLHQCYPGPAAFFRRKVVDTIGGRDPQFRYTADYDFWLRAGLVGPFMRIPEFLATFRVHGTAQSNETGALMAGEHIRLIDKLYARNDLPKELLVVKKQAYSTAYYAMGMTIGEQSGLRSIYFRKALMLAPHIYFIEYPMRLLEILPFQHQLKFIWRFFKGVKNVAISFCRRLLR